MVMLDQNFIVWQENEMAKKGEKVVFTEEHCKNLSLAGIGRPSPMKGKKVSQEIRDKQSNALKGRKHKPESIALMRKNRKGKGIGQSRLKSPEQRLKLHLANLGHKDSEETKEKKSLAAIARLQRGYEYGKRRPGILGWWRDKNNRILLHRSLLELQWFHIFDKDPNVLCFVPEPFHFRYEYEGFHRYVPDVFVIYIDGRMELIEIKPDDQWNDPVNQAKWKVAKDWCSTQCVEFRVIGFNEDVSRYYNIDFTTLPLQIQYYSNLVKEGYC